MRVYRILFFICFPTLLNCQPNKDRELKKTQSSILSSFNSFWAYANKYYNFSKNYIVVDTADNIIDKNIFLKQLSEGKILPIRQLTTDSPITYIAVNLKKTEFLDQDIANTLKSIGQIQYQYLLKEGQGIGSFDLRTIDGRIFNEENTKGKILILKCWFINCQKCNEEISMLNELVEKYKQNENCLFVSLALDSENSLRNFLKHLNFKYSVVANQGKFINEKLNITLYPTHLIIDKNGKVFKITNDGNDLDELLLQLTK